TFLTGASSSGKNSSCPVPKWPRAPAAALLVSRSATQSTTPVAAPGFLPRRVTSLWLFARFISVPPRRPAGPTPASRAPLRQDRQHKPVLGFSPVQVLRLRSSAAEGPRTPRSPGVRERIRPRYRPRGGCQLPPFDGQGRPKDSSLELDVWPLSKESP